MIGIDTNILLRAITQDDAAYSKRATEFLKTCTPSQQGLINPVVLAECMWTLKRRYKAKSEDIVLVLCKILENDGLHVMHRKCVEEATAMEEKCAGSFTDAFIAALNREEGCATTASFDKEIRDGISFVEPENTRL